MKSKNIVKYLNSFGKYVVKQSRTNLTKGKKNADKGLYNSIEFKVIADKKGFTVQFSMESYGKFVDKGVSGTDKKRTYKDYSGKTVPSPYKYKSKQPPSSIIEKWIKTKGLRGRVDKKWKGAGNRGGQFITDKSFAFLIARSIKEKGIKGISFFQRPLELGIKRLGNNILKGIREDITQVLKDIN
tara:strand:- start:2274 stop:2828 length:555 start_codon:yes stop_codon:yes gene_type:complete